MVPIAFLLGDRHLWEVVENKPASSLVVSLGKALNGALPPSCGRQAAQTLDIATLKRVRAYIPKHSNTIRFLANGG